MYKEEDVNRMAASIKAAGGVDQALLIAPVPREDYRENNLDPNIAYYYTVDGNLRLTSARHLGDIAPLLKCEIVGAGKLEQMRIMLTTTEFYFKKSPIGRANAFQILKKEFGLSDLAIARQTGVSYPTVQSYLMLLKLEKEIQALIDQGFSHDIRVTRALLHIPDSTTRVELATHLFKRKATIPVCLRAAGRVADALNATSTPEEENGTRRAASSANPHSSQNGSSPSKALPPEPPSVMTPLGAIIFHFAANAAAFDAFADLLAPYDQPSSEDARDLAALDKGIVAKLKMKGLEGLSYVAN